MPRSRDEHLFERLLDEPECEWIEFKQNWFDPAAIGRYASALANSARLEGASAGYLVWGVSNDRQLVGTDLDPRLRVVQRQPFEFWLKQRLRPSDHDIRFVTGSHEGSRLVALVSTAADRVPVRFESIPYIRIGSATPALADHPDRERQLLAALTATNIEDDLARELVSVEDIFGLLDVDEALALLRQTAASEPAEQLRQLSRFSVIFPQGANRWSISVAGALLFARDLNDFGTRYERKAPRVIRYVGDTRVRTESEQVGRRGYAIGFEGLANFIDRQLPRSERLRGVLRTDHSVYPLLAVRELVANALIHQDLSSRGAGPLVEIFDRRIEITNPGQPLVEVDRLIDEPPKSRNERIARLMRQIGYCEERGSGIDRVVTFAEAYQLPPPEFEVKQQSFWATLHAPRAFAEMTSQERIRACYQHACLLWVAGGQTMTNSTLRQRFGLAANRAAAISRLFADAVAAGAIKPVDPSNQSRSQSAYLPYWA